MKCWQLLSLVAVVAGSPVSPIQENTQMLSARRNSSPSAPLLHHNSSANIFEEADSKSFTATQTDLTDFQFFVQYAGAAYCNSQTPAGQPIVCANDACPGVAATVIDSFEGSLTGIGGFVAVDAAHQQIILAIRGTKNIRNFVTDIAFAFEDCAFAPGCQVHDGFSKAWDEIADAATAAVTQAVAANPSFGIIATGHSLGGAVATLGATVLRGQGFPIDIYTYGSPRVGNDVFANFVTSQPGAEFRVTHVDDPVPRLPPIILDYRHVSPEFWLSTGDGDTVSYAVADVAVCTGIDNVDCNGGTSGIDLTAHSFYFEKVSGCAPSGLQFKRDDNSTASGIDQFALDRMAQWSLEDQAFVASIKA
ncbi:extracellular lipase-like protein [Trichoderma reesei QM6a]|uniref:Extracellular lipase-like protein n=1 Tax=Hypocrea jecorina (strain QM6a) TaxID=431241 RepID=G0RGQ0_HYPJQ|nr:extracellular lipase-like protein [Trichoderma reesei QM6a]EGR49340.1 extracellular lipase-like protein [Trichoderma reesei QM6a]